MKIVLLDGCVENPGDLSWSCLEALGELTVYDRTSYVDTPLIAERIGDADIVLTNKTPLTRSTLEKCPNLKMIATLSTGYNVVDCDCAKEKGIPVCNVPAYGTASVAQYAVALLLEVCHHVGHHSQTVYEGKWQNHIDWSYWDFPLVELDGKTAGIIGFGRIGQATGRILRALGMNVLANSPHPGESGRAIAAYVGLDELLAKSDVILLHCNLTPENTGIINKDTIARMKDGVILINTARGQHIVEQDLADALNSGKVAGAAVDVVSVEPIKAENPLLQAKNCIITPHMAWGAKEARQRILDITAANVKAFLSGEPQNVVNR